MNMGTSTSILILEGVDESTRIRGRLECQCPTVMRSEKAYYYIKKIIKHYDPLNAILLVNNYQTKK